MGGWGPFRSKTKTVTDIQCQSLLEPYGMDKRLEKMARYQSGGSSYNYFVNYKLSQHRYKKLFTPEYVRNIGFNVQTSMNTWYLSKAKLLNYVKQSVDSQATSIEYSRIGYLTDSEMFNIAIQNMPGFDYTKRTVARGRWFYYTFTHTIKDNTAKTALVVTITGELSPSDDIIGYAKTNYQYDYTTELLYYQNYYWHLELAKSIKTFTTNYKVDITRDKSISKTQIEVIPKTGTLATIASTNINNYVFKVNNQLSYTDSDAKYEITKAHPIQVGKSSKVTVRVTSLTDSKSIVNYVVTLKGYNGSTASTKAFIGAKFNINTVITKTLTIPKKGSISYVYTSSLFKSNCVFMVYKKSNYLVNYAISGVGSSKYFDKRVGNPMPLVALKVNGSEVHTTPMRERLFKKLNLGKDSFNQAVRSSNRDVKDMYFTVAVNIKNTDPHIAKYLFMFFEEQLIGSGSGSVTVPWGGRMTEGSDKSDPRWIQYYVKIKLEHSVQINTTTNGKPFNFSYSANVINSTGTVGTKTGYSSTFTKLPLWSSGPSVTGLSPAIPLIDGWELKKQLPNNKIKILRIFSVNAYIRKDFCKTSTASWGSSGFGTWSYYTVYDYSKSYIPVPVSVDILKKFSYKDFVPVYDNSVCIVAYASKSYKVKWYQSGFFGFLLQVVGIIAIVLTGGAATPAALLTTMLVGVAVSVVASVIAKKIGGTIGAIIGTVAAIAVGVITGYLDLSSIGTWFLGASTFLSTLQQNIQHEGDRIAALGKEYVETLRKKSEDIEDKLKDEGYMEDFNVLSGYSLNNVDDSYAGEGFSKLYASIGTYCENFLNTSVDYLADYSTQIDNAIEVRNSVKII